MPEPVREGTYKGKPTIGVLTGVGRDGTEFWKDLGLSFWKAALDNIDQIRKIVDRHERPHGHNDK